MKLATYIIGIIALITIVVGIAMSGALKERSTIPDYVASHGLDERAQAVGQADARLSRQLSSRLGLGDSREPEIDLTNPTEADVRFLMEMFRGKEAAARHSAARALISAQEPRAVGLLARAAGGADEEAYYCAGAFEILRFKTKEQAAELMIDLLEDTESPVREGCRSEMQQKLKFIGGEAPEVLGALVSSASVRVRRFTLKQLPPSGDGELRETIRTLTQDRDPAVAALARKWLAQAIPTQQPASSDEVKVPIEHARDSSHHG